MSIQQQNMLQAPTASLGPEVTTALRNFGTSEEALRLLQVMARHGEHGRRASNEIAQPSSCTLSMWTHKQ